MHLISLSEKGNRPEIVNIADDLPSTNIEVLTYAGKLLKSSLPSIEPFKNVFTLDTTFYYPEDRGISESIGFGRDLVRRILSKNS